VIQIVHCFVGLSFNNT